MDRSSYVAVAASIAFAVAAGACGSSSDASGFDTPTSADGGTRDTPSFGGASASDAGAGLPPEKKIEESYQSPVATGGYVWVANPLSGRVAYIRATTLDVSTVLAGDGPTYLAAVPDTTADVAIVLNVLSQDATLLRAAAGTLSTRTFPVAESTNAWAISADGHWAIAWADATKAKHLDPTQGFQDLSVLDLTGPKPATILAVGYRPVKIAFSGDGSRAFAVTQDGISVIDLTGPVPLVLANYATSDDPVSDPGTHDVSFTPDGAYALVRRDNEVALTVVALGDGTRTTVTLPSPPTDLALSPSGDRAVVAMRDIASVAVLPIPAIVTDPLTFTTIGITGQTVGRAVVTPPGNTALLFTTVASAAPDTLTVLSLATPQTFRTLRLYAPLLGVFPMNDANSAVVLHDMTGVASATTHGAFSLVRIGSAPLPAKIVSTIAPPNAVALSPSSDRAIVTVRDDATGTFGAYVAKMPSLEVDPYIIASPPIAAGVVAGANRAFVAQDHPEGRITFIDLVTGEARTITGFELGARVVNGSQP